MNENIINDKSFQFVVRVVKLYKYLYSKKEFVLSKQLLRSCTSIGANVLKSQNVESKADFIHKLEIAQKEADETLNWLELLNEADYLSIDEFQSIYNDGVELLKIIRSIIKTSKNNK